MRRKDDQVWLRDIVSHAEEAMRYVRGKTAAQYAKDRRLQLQIERLLEIVGEASSRLSPEWRERIDFDWPKVRGLRNILAHQYSGIDHAIVYRIVVNRLPGLVTVVLPHLKNGKKGAEREVEPD